MSYSDSLPEIHLVFLPGCLCASTNQIAQSCHVVAHSSSIPSLFLSWMCPSQKSLVHHFLSDPSSVTRPEDGRSDWLSSYVYFLVFRTMIKHCSAAFATFCGVHEQWEKFRLWDMCSNGLAHGCQRCPNALFFKFSFDFFFFLKPSVIVIRFIVIIPQFAKSVCWTS